jgi:16S rRNA (guanine527-N7)-methyltransferase
MQLSLDNVSVIRSRAEDLASEGSFDCVVCRALGPVPRILPQIAPLLAPGGSILAMKGRTKKNELDCLPQGFMIAAIHALQVPGMDAERHLLVISETDRS